MLTALAAEGALGVKSGCGLLGRYDDRQVREIIELRARVLLALDGMPPSLTGYVPAVPDE